MAYSMPMVKRKDRPKPKTHPFDTGRVSTIELILSVTVARVYPGSMTGALPSAISTLVGPFML